MKTSKSPVKTEVTPSKKKLKQGTLPFKPKNDVPPAPLTPQSRKRKLSAPEAESVTKIGKIAKENGVVEDPVVISDDDSKDCDKSVNLDKLPNPFVKLVDTAFKKKQKAKKKKNGKNKSSNNNSNGEVQSVAESAENKEQDSEMMEVDETTEVTVPNADVPDNDISKDQETLTKETAKEVKNNEDVPSEETDNSVNLQSESDNLEENNSADNTSQDDCDKKSSSTDNTEVKPSNSSSDKDTTEPTNETQVTPKRSARNKGKEQNNNSKGSPNSKLNSSIVSNPSTPKQAKTSRSSSVTNSQGDVSLNESTPSASLTPKQLQKKLESAKKREEREKEKEEKEKKRQQEKEERAKQKQEKEEQKKKEREEKEEAKRKEKEEKEEQKRKEKEEKEKIKELEKKQREEKEEQKRKEREEKEEQRKKEKEAKEEEKRKKQEALELEKQEQELKKKKAAEAFVNFFVPKQKTEKEQATTSCISQTCMLSNFTIKSDMRLAPLVRVKLSEDQKENLVNVIEKQGVTRDNLYLKCLKKGTKPLSSGKTWPYDKEDDDDVMIVEDELPPVEGVSEILNCDNAPREKLRPKLLSFHENRRPPYWGTWRKKSSFIKPRKPFKQDEKLLDYEVDSDDDWEEEQEGESLDGSAAGSDDEQDGDEYEVDNVVFVPHGYLSDEEATMDEDDVLSLSPDTQKQRLKHLEDEFESEMKKPTEKLKPRMYGLLWETADGGKPENCVDALWNYFGKLSMIMNDITPLLQPAPVPEEPEKKKVKKKRPVVADGEQKSPKSDKKKKSKQTDEKEGKSPKPEVRKNIPETKKNQPGINMFLTKLKST